MISFTHLELRKSMPVNIFGEWIPEKGVKEPVKPVKVRVVKRGKSTLTVILNLERSSQEMEDISSSLKKNLGCGGSVKGGDIEIQGDKLSAVQKFLAQKYIFLY